MSDQLKRISIDKHPDIAAWVRQLLADQQPRILEESGKPIAGLVTLEVMLKLLVPEDRSQVRLSDIVTSAASTQSALAAAGAWSDVDSDALIQSIYEARHASPSRPPLEL